MKRRKNGISGRLEEIRGVLSNEEENEKKIKDAPNGCLPNEGRLKMAE